MREHVREEYEQWLRQVDDPADGTPAPSEEHAALWLALTARARAAVVRLRDDGQIDDDVLRRMQSTLDFEELRLSRRQPRSQ